VADFPGIGEEGVSMSKVSFGVFDWIDRGTQPLSQLYEDRLQKAVTRPKPVERPTRICLSIYRGTAGTLGFAKPPVSSPWAHDVLK
jgi:hypothetical protein